MAKKQPTYCINCGEQINGAKFCPKCGTKQDIGTFNTNTNDNTNNNTITVNVNSKTENEKASLSLDELIQKAQTELEAKDFDTLKQTAKEIQTNFPKSFYGWYFEAICIMESPIDGAFGKLAKGLTVFSNALTASIASNKQRTGAEIKGAGFQALGVLTMENFQARIFKAIKCISGSAEEISTQQELAFGLLSNLTEKVWLAYNHKTCITWFGSGEKPAVLRSHEAKLNSFIIKIYNEMKETSSVDCIAYKRFMGKNYGEYMRTLNTIKYKQNVFKHPTRKETYTILKTFEEYCPDDINTKKIDFNSPKVKFALVFISMIVFGVIIFLTMQAQQPNVPYDL